MAADAPLADDLLTEEQRTQFLDSLREGIAHGVAARGLGVPGLTGTKLRGVRSRDPVFRMEVEEAMAEGKRYYQERLSSQARLRALSGSDRMLEVELATHVAGYEHLRRDKVTVDGKIENGIILYPGWEETMPTQVLQIIRDHVAGMVVEGEFIELPPDDDEPPGLPVAA